MKQENMNLREFGKILFPLACLLLIGFSFGYNAFNTDFSLAISSALFVLLLVEALLFIFKSYTPFWARIRWLILGALALLILIG